MLTNLKLTINQAYISSDGGWFMDGVCRAAASFPTVFGKFKKIDERKMVPLWGDAKSGFCLGCDLSTSFFSPILMCDLWWVCGFALPFCSVPCRGSGWE